MRIALCQINTTMGDLPGNRARCLAAVREAAAQGAALAVLPELALAGYPATDLLDRPAFVDANLRSLEQLAGELPRETAALVGFVDRAAGPVGGLHNAVALIRSGRVAQVFHKRLLPTYDVFYEDRYFAPGLLPPVFELDGMRFGVTICEDAWNAVESPLRQRYDSDPVADCVARGAHVLINVSGSPFNLAKREGRPAMLAAIAAQHRLPLVFVNLVGGNDDLIFDGSSALYAGDGALCAALPSFAEQVLTCELAAPAGFAATPRDQPRARLPQTDAEAALAALVLGTRDYAHKCGFTRAVLGLSGGIDSSLVASIAARALGAENVLGVAMPTRYSSEHSLADARALAQALGIEFRVIAIDAIFQRYLDALGPELEALGPAPAQDTTFENIQARIRGNTLMAISNRLGHLLLTTGNKSEIAVGYCTLYGDMAGGLAVISDLPKTFVYEVAREFNRQAGASSGIAPALRGGATSSAIPASVFEKAPSAELRPDQKDEDSLPPYPLLDRVLEQLVEDGRSTEQVVAGGFDPALVQRIAEMVRRNEYKRRQMPPGLIVTRKAFGPGRRYPIAHRYHG